MTEPRETPLVEPEDDGEGRPAPSRRFARLAESPAARRLALPRLVGAFGAGLVAVGLLWVGDTRVVRSLTAWVESQPEYRLAFSEITLDPAPPPYIRTGAVGILHKVRSEARREERFSVPSIDLKELEKDFRRCPWVEDVGQIRRSYRRLVVPLVYRRPVAVGRSREGLAVVVDKDAVILPQDEVDWVEEGPRFRARGIGRPLFFLARVKPPASDRPGLTWKRADAVDSLQDRDLQVLSAARLADFLLARPGVTPGGKPAPDLVEIQPDEHHPLRFFLRDQEDHWVFWDQAPGAEPIGELAAEEKWKMIADWVDQRGALDAKYPDYRWPNRRNGFELRKGNPALPRAKGPR